MLETPAKPNPSPTADVPDHERWLELVREHVRSLRFGVVQVIVHESRVVQIEKTERVRFHHPKEKSLSQ